MTSDPLVGLIGLIGRRSGVGLITSKAAAELRISAATQGIVNGWFIWPVNFDPVWLENCDGFTPKEPQEASTS